MDEHVTLLWVVPPQRKEDASLLAKFWVEDRSQDEDSEPAMAPTLCAKFQPPLHPTMNTRLAVRLSREKWRFLADWIEDHPDDPVPSDGGRATCALCRRFYACIGCPVRAISPRVHRGCACTPYDFYERARLAGNHQDARHASCAEVAFLTLLELALPDLLEQSDRYDTDTNS